MMAIKTQPPLKREIKRFQPTLYIAREVRRMEDDGGYASAILVSKGEEGPVGGHLEVTQWGLGSNPSRNMLGICPD